VTAAAYLLTAACRNYELYRLVREQAARLGQMLRSQRSIAAQRMAILSSLADGVAVLDEKGRVSLINATVTRIMRPTTLALEGQPWEALLGGFSDQALDAVREMMDNLRSGEGTRADPLSTVVGRDEQSVLVTVAPMVDEHLHFEGTVLVFRDVTAEQEIAQAKTDFVSTVAHELRTPMTSIKGYTDLLLKGAAGPINDEQVRFLDIVKSNVSRMADLVADLLDISRIEAGRASLEPKPLDLGGVLAEVRDSVIETVHARDLSFSLDAAPGLPRVVADRSRLIQILNNLVSNAYRYTPPGGEIRVSARRVSNMVQIDVQDTGIGIAPQDQERIFERFYRANHPMVNRQAGTGLGLPIVRSLVELHGGRLWLNSELEKGSVFSFTLLVANR